MTENQMTENQKTENQLTEIIKLVVIQATTLCNGLTTKVVKQM